MYMNLNKTVYGVIKVKDLGEQAPQELQNMMLGELYDEHEVQIPHPKRTFKELIEYMNPNTLNYIKHMKKVPYQIVPFYDRIDSIDLSDEDAKLVQEKFLNAISPYAIILEHIDDWNWDVEKELTTKTK